MADHSAMRKRRQPLDFPSAGSVFKNPPNDHAGRLIESVGLKGRRVGGAVISEIHANYIVNTGKAKASDVLELMALAQRIVKDETGIELEPEIMVVGG
jgi:UDP-N-acetylmuramate dehydrogenase